MSRPFVHATGNCSAFSSGLFSSMAMVTHATSFVFLNSYFRFFDYIIQRTALMHYNHIVCRLDDEQSTVSRVLDCFGQFWRSFGQFGLFRVVNPMRQSLERSTVSRSEHRSLIVITTPTTGSPHDSYTTQSRCPDNSWSFQLFHYRFLVRLSG